MQAQISMAGAGIIYRVAKSTARYQQLAGLPPGRPDI
jgi:hypothetical protein